jgi:hypothetical protein
MRDEQLYGRRGTGLRDSRPASIVGQVVSTGSVLSTTNIVLSISNNADGTFTLSMLGTPQGQYYLQAVSDLTPPASWTPVSCPFQFRSGILSLDRHQPSSAMAAAQLMDAIWLSRPFIFCHLEVLHSRL